MARRTHDGKLHPIVNSDASVPTGDGMRPDVGLVAEGPGAPVPLIATADGKLKVEATVTGGVGASAVDEEAFVESSTTFTPAGGAYDDTLGDLSAGQLAVGRLTKRRAVHSNLRSATGAELGIAGSPLVVGDGASSLTVDDGGGSLTVDGTVAVTVADGANIALGATTDPEATGDGSAIAILKRLRTDSEGVLSSGNSTDTPLGANGVFTGAWEDVTNYASVTVFVTASIRSKTSDGCHLQFSTDGVTVMDEFLMPYQGSSLSIPLRTSLPRLARYFRVTYLNHETLAQTVFHLQTIYHPTKTQDGLLLSNGLVIVNGTQKKVTSFNFNTMAASTTVASGLGNSAIRTLVLVLTASATAKITLFSGFTILEEQIIDPRQPFILNMLPFGQVGIDGGFGQPLLLKQTAPLAKLTGYVIIARV